MLGDVTNVTRMSVPKKTKNRPISLFCERVFETQRPNGLSSALHTSHFLPS